MMPLSYRAHSSPPTQWITALLLTFLASPAFGFSLSSTTFEISDPILSASVIAPDGSTNVSVSITNTGVRPGDDVIQPYIRDSVSSVTRPVKELKGFQRVTLTSGETQPVALSTTPEDLRFFDRNIERIVERGEFEIMVGNSSDTLKTTILTVQ